MGIAILMSGFETVGLQGMLLIYLRRPERGRDAWPPRTLRGDWGGTGTPELAQFQLWERVKFHSNDEVPNEERW